MLYTNVQCGVVACAFVYVCVCVYVYQLVRRLNLDSERILCDCSPNLKVRGDEIEELHNRLKILSIDRRSFKFRHPGEARNITLMIYDLSWNVHTV